MRKVVFNQHAYPLGKGLTIGKAADNDVVLPEAAGVEDNHAKVAVVGPYVFLEDLDTDKGTLLNGEKIRRTAVKKGDKIKIGDSRLVYEEDDQPEPAGKPSGARAKAADQKPAARKTPSGAGSPAARQRPGGGEKRSSGLGRASGKGGRIKVAGMADVEKSASSAQTPAIQSPARPGSSTHTPAVPPRALRPGSSTRGAAIKPGSSGEHPGKSGARTPIPKSAEFTAVQDAAQKAIDQSRKDTAPKPVKMTSAGILGMILLLFATVLIVFVTPHVKNWLNAAEKARGESDAKEATLARLKNDEFKRRSDLQTVLHSLRSAESITNITDVLGEPNVEDSGRIVLYRHDKGCYDYMGGDFKAYFVADDENTDLANVGAVINIVLFEVDEDGVVTYRGPFLYARADAPKLKQPPRRRIVEQKVEANADWPLDGEPDPLKVRLDPTRPVRSGPDADDAAPHEEPTRPNPVKPTIPPTDLDAAAP